MNFTQLLTIINQATNPKQILAGLSAAQFAITDTTIEGSSVLHALAQSSHVREYDFATYLEQLIAAGAMLNVIDKQNKHFIVYFMEHVGHFASKTLTLLLEQSSFDVNYATENGYTFFEFIYNTKGFDKLFFLRALFARPDFNPNQKTSKHPSILLHLIAEQASDDYILAALANNQFNTKIKNKEGKTALGLVLSKSGYKDLSVIRALINAARSEINTVDSEGNNYLHLTILSSNFQCEEITSLLLQQQINWRQRNNNDQCIFDLIKINRAQRSPYSNTQLVLAIVAAHPEALFEKYINGQTVLNELLLDKANYFNYTKIGELCRLCIELGHHKALTQAISEYLYAYQQGIVPETQVLSFLNELPKDVDAIDVEYCLARVLLSSNSKQIILKLREMKSPLNVEKLTGYAQELFPENSDERTSALNAIQAITWHMHAFDEAMLTWEEQHLSSQSKPDIKTHTSLFGHLFSLKGSVPLNGELKDLSSNHAHVTVPFMVHLMNAYFSDCEKNKIHVEHLEAIRQVRNMTVMAMRILFLKSSFINYYPENTSMPQDVLITALEESQGVGVELISGWQNHAISMIIKQDNFYRNNGGGCSTDQAIEHYKITKREAITTGFIAPILQNADKESNKKYIQQEIHDLLGLNYIGSVPGAFQSTGNCSFYSLLLALKVKYRLFIAEEEIADALFADTVKFFERLYLNEYIALYAHNPVLPHLLLQLLIQKLIPENELGLSKTLLTQYFNSEWTQKILREELMLERFRRGLTDKSIDEFTQQLQTLGIDLTPITLREQILTRLLANQLTAEDLSVISTWSADEQYIQGCPLLHFAVTYNNLPLATFLIEEFPDSVNQKNWRDNEALCFVKSVDMIELLIANGATLTRETLNNPLDCAILADDLALVSALLQHGAKTSEYSAYFAASRDPQILKLFMKYHPQTIAHSTHDYSISMHAAASSGKTENIRTLVYEAGLSTAVSDVNGLMPLHLALKEGHDETASALLQYPGTLFKRPYRGDSFSSMTKNSALQKTIERTEQERIEDVAAFAQFKEEDPGLVLEDIDYLMLALPTNNLSIIRGCLISYPNISVVANSGLYCNTPLTKAIQNLAGKKGSDYNNALKIVELLLKTPGININACMASTEPLIFMATSINNVNVLELFLADPNLNLNQQDNVGYTALHDAVERGHWQCVRRLLKDERLDSTIRNKQNKTAGELKSNKFCLNNCIEEVRQHQKNVELHGQPEDLSLMV
ncbi:MAG: ankyrin repeat domain-containing protein [Legionella sp.]|uniref:ankyrin repeat domain-containing protein n=1 Tax=Legionella sp. TaxID=459 RepID=UPI00284D1EC5|nr:ankyrin repeat domain-containing protein [Legionella sp.]